MKKTAYFSGIADHPQKIDLAIEAASKKQGQFLLDNKENVAEVCGEDLKNIQWPNGAHITAVIQMSYYRKQ